MKKKLFFAMLLVAMLALLMACSPMPNLIALSGVVSTSPEAIAAMVGFGLMLVFAYFPKLRVWFGGLASEHKSYIMAGLLVLATVIIWLLAYYGVIVTDQPMTWESFFKIVLAILVANQPTYTLLPEAADVKAARLARNTKALKSKPSVK
jgi:MFS family permease